MFCLFHSNHATNAPVAGITWPLVGAYASLSARPSMRGSLEGQGQELRQGCRPNQIEKFVDSTIREASVV